MKSLFFTAFVMMNVFFVCECARATSPVLPVSAQSIHNNLKHSARTTPSDIHHEGVGFSHEFHNDAACCQSDCRKNRESRSCLACQRIVCRPDDIKCQQACADGYAPFNGK